MQTTYLNTPIKNCTTCAHFRLAENHTGSSREQFGYCVRFGGFASVARKYDCGRDLAEWRQAPPSPPASEPRGLFAWVSHLFNR